jgi:hypothetical protein
MGVSEQRGGELKERGGSGRLAMGDRAGARPVRGARCDAGERWRERSARGGEPLGREERAGDKEEAARAEIKDQGEREGGWKKSRVGQLDFFHGLRDEARR